MIDSLGGDRRALCADSIDKQRLAVRASGVLDLTLLVGAEKAELFTLQICKGVSVAVIVDLARASAAAAAVLEPVPYSITR